MLGQGDFIMRQEQYQDLLREAGHERLIQTDRKPGPSLWGLREYLAELLRARVSLERRLIGFGRIQKRVGSSVTLVVTVGRR